MAAILKYVNTPQGIVVFGMETQHDNFRHLKPTSAGAFSLDGKDVHAYGNSTSLNLRAVEGQDSEAIKKMLGL